MGKRRAKHPFEDNPFIDGCLEWMDAPEGQQSIEASSIWCSAHWNMPASTPGSARSSGPTGNGYRSSTRPDRIHTEHPDVPRHLIETHLQELARKLCSKILLQRHQLEELNRLIGPWLDDYERTSRAARE